MSLGIVSSIVVGKGVENLLREHQVFFSDAYGNDKRKIFLAKEGKSLKNYLIEHPTLANRLIAIGIIVCRALQSYCTWTLFALMATSVALPSALVLIGRVVIVTPVVTKLLQEFLSKNVRNPATLETIDRVAGHMMRVAACVSLVFSLSLYEHIVATRLLATFIVMPAHILLQFFANNTSDHLLGKLEVLKQIKEIENRVNGDTATLKDYEEAIADLKKIDLLKVKVGREEIAAYSREVQRKIYGLCVEKRFAEIMTVVDPEKKKTLVDMAKLHANDNQEVARFQRFNAHLEKLISEMMETCSKEGKSLSLVTPSMLQARYKDKLDKLNAALKEIEAMRKKEDWNDVLLNAHFEIHRNAMANFASRAGKEYLMFVTVMALFVDPLERLQKTRDLLDRLHQPHLRGNSGVIPSSGRRLSPTQESFSGKAELSKVAHVFPDYCKPFTDWIDTLVAGFEGTFEAANR